MHPIGGIISSSKLLPIITYDMPLLAFKKSQEGIVQMLILLPRQRRSKSEWGTIYVVIGFIVCEFINIIRKVFISLNITLGYYIIYVCTGIFYTEV